MISKYDYEYIYYRLKILYPYENDDIIKDRTHDILNKIIYIKKLYNVDIDDEYEQKQNIISLMKNNSY